MHLRVCAPIAYGQGVRTDRVELEMGLPPVYGKEMPYLFLHLSRKKFFAAALFAAVYFFNDKDQLMKSQIKLLLSLVIILLLAGCQGSFVKTTIDPNEVILTVTDADSVVNLTYADFQALGIISGYGGIKTTTGRISGPDQYSGVDLMDLIKLVDASGDAVSVQVEASDGYAITFSSEQIKNGKYLTYDPKTGEVNNVNGNLTTIIASKKNGEPLDAEQSGHLRLHIISKEGNQVTDGHWSVKFIKQIKLKPLVQNWVLKLKGEVEENIDRATFEAGTAEKCHQAVYTDSAGNEWKGIPLWLLVGRVDDEITHGDNAYNDDLARSGYTVEVISMSGKSTTFNSLDVMRNNKILVVHLLNDNPLTEADFPLRLIGEDINQENEVLQIDSILLHLP